MTYPYLARQIQEIVAARKVLRRPELLAKGKPLPFTAYGDKGRKLVLEVDFANGARVFDLHFHVRAPIFDNPESFVAALLLANQRVRGIDWHPTGKKRYYRQAIPKGWHQNVIDPNLPPDHPDENRHVPIIDFAPADLTAFFIAAAKTWNITLPEEDFLL